ncbi:MAG: hypothetical protein V7634_2298 [Bradyrhizobium sp.]|jgi:hypothetical protein
MRQRNWRLFAVGVLLLGFAVAFFLVMLGMTPRSTDAAEMLKRVGQIAGGIGGVGVALAILGLIGKKASAG